MKSKQTPENHIAWCLKKGVLLEKPNETLCLAYLQKAKSALNMLNAALEIVEVDWIATTAYYARYFSLYALLQKCGIKSEIHDCTISLMYYLFVKQDIIEEQYYEELLLAKELRIDVQYYVTEKLDKEKLKNDSKTAGPFVLEIERVIESITNAKITFLRKKLSSLK